MRFQYVLVFFFYFAFVGCSQKSKVIVGSETTFTKETLSYYLYYPKDYEVSNHESFGLLLFLHGGGESGQNLEELKKNGPPKMMVDGYPFPFLVLAPQNPHKRKWWNVHAVKQLLDKIIKENNVDPNRIYLTGLSRGGSAAWEMAVQYPETFAALAVVCGMAPTPYADWLDKKMPIWVFHGVEDNVIPVQESDLMVKKLKKLGYSVKYDRYQGIGHDSWTKAYQTPELYDWMFQQNRAQ
ncbi:dienelactone hydrolase family protein [Croceivirga thetidis]|uniref:Alpha/beta hydrolase n=1 Tax=Croceivirga thetidis TaxID=2721623 RepID=A0ABX1GQV9_9FLAO|nr:PHB depolymerase family esterase [Croceivirga thetidis]NKI31979.1 alpha/beta hydrolase [Croceivirga thetidis]